MSNDMWVILLIFVFGLIMLIGFFLTKKEGFGKYATSTLLIIASLTVSSIFYAAGNLNSQVMTNVIFAVIGFAGGLFTSKDSE